MIYRLVITQTIYAYEEIEADSTHEAEDIALEHALAGAYDFNRAEAEYAVTGEWYDD